MKLEKGVGFSGAVGDFKAQVSSRNIGSGVVAGIFGLSAGVILISVGTAAGLGSDLIMRWVTSVYVIAGLMGILLPIYYRMPLPMAISVPGALLFVATIASQGLGPTLGATLVAGIIALIIGLSGAMGMVMRIMPMPVVMAMVAGILLSFGLNMVRPLGSAFVPAVIMIGSFLLATRFIPKVPAVIVTLAVGVVYLLITGVDFSSVRFVVDYPRFVMPEFTLSAILAYGIPLAVILVGMETPAAVGILRSQQYLSIPANSITAVNGVGSIISAFFHLHTACISALMLAMCSSPEAGKHSGRWIAASIAGLIWLVGGIIYGSLVTVFQVTPAYFIAIIAGLALARVLYSLMSTAFSGRFQMGAIFAFLIAASGIQILGIGAAFWSLVFGALISLIVEPQDFKTGESVIEDDPQKAPSRD